MRSTYGSVDLLPSGRHRARITLGRRSRSLGTYPTDAEAWGVVAAAQDEIARGHVEVGGADTLRVVGPRWLDARELDGVRGIRTERSRWRTHIEPWPLSAAPLRTLRRGDVRDWLAGVARASSRQTAQRCLSLLRGMLDDAADRGLVDTNAAIGVRLPGRPGRVEDVWSYLSPSEQIAYLTTDSIPEADRILIAIAMGTGMRQGEQCAARIDDVDLPGERMTIRRSQDGATKSGKPRTIPLFGLGLRATRAWLSVLGQYAPRNPKRLLCPTPAGAQRQPGHPLGTVWDVVEGKRRRVDRWHALCDGAGLRRVRWHDLRHTCASSLVAGWWGRRWSLEEVCAYLGHSSIAVTQRYAHVGETALTRAGAVTDGLCHDDLAFAVGQPGLEPGTDGLKVQKSSEYNRIDTLNHDSTVTLAAKYLHAVAEGDPRSHAIGVRLAEGVLASVARPRAVCYT